MKKKIYRSLTIMMAFLVLLSSTGFGLTEHLCLVSGKSVRSFFEDNSQAKTTVSMSNCCAKDKVATAEGKTYFQKAECCIEQHSLQKTEIVNTQLQTKSQKIGQLGLLYSTTSSLFLRAHWQLLPSSFQGNSPNPFSCLLHGKAMLIFIQSFLI